MLNGIASRTAWLCGYMLRCCFVCCVTRLLFLLTHSCTFWFYPGLRSRWRRIRAPIVGGGRRREPHLCCMQSGQFLKSLTNKLEKARRTSTLSRPSSTVVCHISLRLTNHRVITSCHMTLHAICQHATCSSQKDTTDPFAGLRIRWSACCSLQC